MAELRLDEVIVDAVIAKLEAGWAARATLINAEKNDGITVAAPDSANFFPGRMPSLPVTPACFVLSGPGAFREQGAHSMTTAYEIHVHVIESAMTGIELARRLMRQTRAVIEVIYDDDPQEALYVSGSSSVKSAYRIFPLRTVPGAVFDPSQGDGWRGSYLTVFRAEQEEN